MSDGKSFFYNTVEDAKEELQDLEKKGTKKALKWFDFGSSKLRDEIKKHPAQYFFLFISTFFGSVVTTATGLFVFSSNILTFVKPQEPIKNTSVAGAAVTVKNVANVRYDPLLLASKLRMKDDSLVVIDIREPVEFQRGHIATSINIPVYGSNLLNEQGEILQEEVGKAFAKHIAGGKLLIIYAQNSYSTIPSDIATIMSEKGYKVKSLAIGWEEWAHLQNR